MTFQGSTSWFKRPRVFCAPLNPARYDYGAGFGTTADYDNEQPDKFYGRTTLTRNIQAAAGSSWVVPFLANVLLPYGEGINLAKIAKLAYAVNISQASAYAGWGTLTESSLYFGFIKPSGSILADSNISHGVFIRRTGTLLECVCRNAGTSSTATLSSSNAITAMQDWSVEYTPSSVVFRCSAGYSQTITTNIPSSSMLTPVAGILCPGANTVGVGVIMNCWSLIY